MVRTGQFVASASQRFWGAEVIITSVTFPACALRTDTHEHATAATFLRSVLSTDARNDNQRGRRRTAVLRRQSDDSSRIES